jgi:hypothetical protein
MRDKETLMIINNKFPILEVSTINKGGSTEILIWAFIEMVISIFFSAARYLGQMQI